MTPLKDKKAEAYALHIQDIVTQLKKKNNKYISYNELTKSLIVCK